MFLTRRQFLKTSAVMMAALTIADKALALAGKQEDYRKGPKLTLTPDHATGGIQVEVQNNNAKDAKGWMLFVGTRAGYWNVKHDQGMDPKDSTGAKTTIKVAELPNVDRIYVQALCPIMKEDLPPHPVTRRPYHWQTDQVCWQIKDKVACGKMP